MVKSHQDFHVYKEAYRLSLDIFKVSLKLPSKVQYSLGDQIRRACLSVPANIAEGFSRKKSKKDFARFLDISRGSNNELIVYLRFLEDLSLINDNNYIERSNAIGKQLTCLIRKVISFK